MKRAACSVLIFFCLGLTALAEDASQALKRPVLVKEIANFHMITPGIIRGGQPPDQDFELLKEYAGVKTVIDLRRENGQIEKERVIVNGLGMDFVSIPMAWNEKQPAQVIDEALSIITDPARQPVFVHCQAGKDRTGLIMAAYRIKYEHWGFDDAVREMLAYGYDQGCCSAMEESLTEWKDTLHKH